MENTTELPRYKCHKEVWALKIAKLEHAAEIPLLIKTTQDRYADLEAEIRAMHPYELPEIVAVPVGTGLPAYLDWITAECASSAPR